MHPKNALLEDISEGTLEPLLDAERVMFFRHSYSINQLDKKLMKFSSETASPTVKVAKVNCFDTLIYKPRIARFLRIIFTNTLAPPKMYPLAQTVRHLFSAPSTS